MDETITIQDLLGCLERASARVFRDRCYDYSGGPGDLADVLDTLRDEIEGLVRAPGTAHSMKDLVSGWIYEDGDEDLWHCANGGIELLTVDGCIWIGAGEADYGRSCAYFPLRAVREVGHPVDLKAACEGLL